VAFLPHETELTSVEAEGTRRIHELSNGGGLQAGQAGQVGQAGHMGSHVYSHYSLLVTTNDDRVRMYDMGDYSMYCKYKGGRNSSMQVCVGE
jgi:hypothetical protein